MKWEGGRAWEDSDGTLRYYIRRRVNGKTYEVKTPATTIKAARAQLERFERDPEGYTPEGDARPEPIYLDDRLKLEFLTHSRDVEHNSASWVHEQKYYLDFWKAKLAGIDPAARSGKGAAVRA